MQSSSNQLMEINSNPGFSNWEFKRRNESLGSPRKKPFFKKKKKNFA